jgi:FkbM family methyltransferase
MGVYDLPVTEAALRLTSPGEIALDAGANIGIMTAALAYRVGPTGAVHAFEPHPAIAQELRANVRRWALPVDVYEMALSDHAGEGRLACTATFYQNRGTGTVSDTGTIPIRLVTLDEIIRGVGPVGVLKIDVEGHELALLRGGSQTLASGRVRDILFEDHHRMPSTVVKLLREAGYTVFGLTSVFNGPKLVSPEFPRPESEPANFLATLDPTRALDLLAARGWTALGRA